MFQLKGLDTNPRIASALEFATTAHAGQLRRYSLEPYIVHPVAVAKLVQSVDHTDDMVVAALLHDVVEDTDNTDADIRSRFGADVLDLVMQLTRPPQSFGDRQTKLDVDIARLREASREAKTIKLADIIDNVSTLAGRAPDFWQIYKAEKIELLKHLHEGDEVLYRRAVELLR